MQVVLELLTRLRSSKQAHISQQSSGHPDQLTPDRIQQADQRTASLGVHAEEADGTEEGDDEDGAGEGSQARQAKGRKGRQGGSCDPSATLEASFEALNVKKLDLAFAVDPLFHKTSALFDAGGARGKPAELWPAASGMPEVV